ncbi:protein phosphatase 1 regulatory subunit 14C-like [Huso huso]|uniref:Protein phosphatase 1 regulatory subunit 14C-like n=1 Tax=Huso huso TaxID=61971 RepID=A0ABR0ZZF1_HUSHU
MSASGAETSTQLPPPPARVFFQAAPTGGHAGTGPATKDDSVQKKNGKVTVKYDRKELRKRLILEEWIIEQLSELYDCEDEEMPGVEIDIDDVLDATSEDERAIKLQESLVDCYKPTEEFVKELLSRIRGMRKLSAPQKKGL